MVTIFAIKTEYTNINKQIFLLNLVSDCDKHFFTLWLGRSR